MHEPGAHLYPEGFTTLGPRAAASGPVLHAPGALYGYCPRCGAPGVSRLAPTEGADKRDMCQQGHKYPSGEATLRPIK